MSEFAAACLSWSATFGYWALIASFALVLVRLAKGPSLPDRIVALDLLTVIATAFIVLLAIDRNEGAFIDVALALGLVSFLATVSFARYVMSRRTSAPDEVQRATPARSRAESPACPEAPDA